VIAGVRGSSGAGLYDVCLIKTNANGVVSVPTEVSTPGSFALENNYPNPFNPISNIQFRIAQWGMVELAVFDMLGRQVATLVNEPKSPGVYIVQWDASGVGSGVYFYRLRTGSVMQTRKMVALQ